MKLFELTYGNEEEVAGAFARVYHLDRSELTYGNDQGNKIVIALEKCTYIIIDGVKVYDKKDKIED